MTIRRVRAPFEFRGHTLDEFQIEAIIALQQDMTTLVSAPTGTGKSLIADFLVDDSLKVGRTVVYTAPIKALVNQKYREFRAAYGARRTGIMTGDLSENPDAPLLVMTTEVLRNMLLRDGRPSNPGSKPTPTDAAAAIRADWIVFDEIHYINHPERGTVWEETILLLPRPFRLLGLSATVPNIDQLAGWLERVQGEPVASIVHEERAVPLRHLYFTGDGRARTYAEAWEYVTGGDLKAETLSIDETSREVGRTRRHADPTRHLDIVGYVSSHRLFPCIYFAFSRRACEQMARDLARRRNFLRPHEREAVHVTVRQMLHQARLRPTDVPGLAAMQEMWHRGIGVHHAGLVPVVKHIVEHLLERRILRIVYATETFAVGVNMPVRTVCFDSVTKFDGRTHRLLTQQEFLQMAGRAGRRGLDRTGTVLIRADAETMAEAGERDWETATLEPIASRLSLSYTTVLNLVERFAAAGSAAHPPGAAGNPSGAGEDPPGVAGAPPGAAEVPPGVAEVPPGVTGAPPGAVGAPPGAGVPRGAGGPPGAGDPPNAIAPTVEAWLARSLFVMQSDDPSVAATRLAAQFAEKVGELHRLGYLYFQPEDAPGGAQRQPVSHTSGSGQSRESADDPSRPLLTAKGMFCRDIWIKELLVTELAFDGTLCDLSPAELAGWAAATVWEPRPRDDQLPPAAPGWLAAVQLAADRIMRRTGPKLRNSLTVEARIAPVITRWANASGGDTDLAKLLRGYRLEAGDFVALCRQAIDLLQQIAAGADDVLQLAAADDRADRPAHRDDHGRRVENGDRNDEDRRSESYRRSRSPIRESDIDNLRELHRLVTTAVAAVDRDVVAASQNF